MAEAYEYAIRIHDLDTGSRSRIIDLCEGTGGSYVVVRETDANRAHYQGWVRCTLECQALRKRLKKAFPECVGKGKGRGNAGYSISFVRTPNYLRYLLKGTEDALPDVVGFKGWEMTPEFVESEWITYWASVPRTKTGKEEKSQESVVRHVSAWVESQAWEDVDEKKADVVRYIVDVKLSQNKPINRHYIRYVFNAVMCIHSPSYKDYFVQSVLAMD